jgi:glycosyl transferase, family 25
MINKAYVINLKRSTDRMEKMSKKLNKIGIKYERFDATDGSKLSDEEINSFTHPICRKYLCSKGMIGCAMSHYRLWKKQIAENQEWMFILEDDAINPVNDVVDRLEKVNKMIKQNNQFFDKPSMIYLHCLIGCYPLSVSLNMKSL